MFKCVFALWGSWIFFLGHYDPFFILPEAVVSFPVLETGKIIFLRALFSLEKAKELFLCLIIFYFFSKSSSKYKIIMQEISPWANWVIFSRLWVFFFDANLLRKAFYSFLLERNLLRVPGKFFSLQELPTIGSLWWRRTKSFESFSSAFLGCSCSESRIISRSFAVWTASRQNWRSITRARRCQK